MLVKTPRTATAMALALSLAVPAPTVAQDRPECTEGVELPCVTDTGAVVETETELQIYIEAFPEEAREAAEGDDGTEAAPSGDTADLPQCAEGAALPCVTDTGAVVETETELQIYIESFPEEASQAEGATPEPDPGPPETAAEASPADEPSAEEAQAEAAVEAEEPTEETVQEPAAGDDAADDAAAETAPADTEGEQAVAEPEPAAPADDAAPLAEGVPDPVEGGTVEADIPEVESETPSAAAAAEDATAGSAEVEETTVTEETARSSTEEFETAIGEEPAAAPASEEDDDDNGLTTLQRVIAAGLAGAAIGAITGQGGEVVSNSGDRLIVREGDGELRVLRDENALLRQPGARVRTETFDDGSTRTTVIREDGTEIVTVRATDGRVLRRTRVLPDGQRIVLFDDTREVAPVDIGALPTARMDAVDYMGDEAALRAALAATLAQDLGRNFSLRQIREISAVRELVPEIEVAINFATGSAAIRPNQAEDLAALGRTMAAMIEDNPGEVFLVEGHTDAVGDARYNLALSDRRAETVALALSEYFDVPPENLVVQGYGESDLKIPTAGAEPENRRANVRRITPLIGAETAAFR